MKAIRESTKKNAETRKESVKAKGEDCSDRR